MLDPLEQDYSWSTLRQPLEVARRALDDHMRLTPPHYEGVRQTIEGLLRSINPRLFCAVATFEAHDLDYSRRVQTVRLRLHDNRLDMQVSADLSSSPLRSVLVTRMLGPLTMIALASAGFKSASGDLLCEVGDEAHGFGLGFCSRNAGCCLIPDSDFFISGGYADFRNELARLPEWEMRDLRIMWRGSSTGIPRRAFDPMHDQPFAWLPRADLCRRLSTGRHRHIADAQISSIVQISDSAAIQAMRDAALIGESVNKVEFARAKAIVDIDGNTNAWSGLFCSLLLGSCVLKIASEQGFKQWYYDAMEPWVHYVPVASDLSDLEEKIDWMLAFDHVAKAIGQQGAQFARHITFETGLREAVSRIGQHLALSSY